MNSLITRVKLDPVHIKVGYAFSRIIAPKEAITLAAQEFSAMVRNSQFIPSVQKQRWDGRLSLINKKDGSFGTGLLGDVIAYFKYKIKCQIEIEDLRTPPEKLYDFTWQFPGELRPVQVNALACMKNSVNGILKMVTGSGKSLCAAKLIQELGVRTLFCVPSKELLYQTAEVFKKNIGGNDFKIGLLGDGLWPDDDCTVVVAMYQTLVSLRGKHDRYLRQQFIETMSSFDLLICDECHKICSQDSITKTWETVMDINSYYRFALSATPYEIEGTIAEMLIRSSFGHIVFNLDMQEAKDSGYVTPFTVVFLKPKYPKEITRMGATGMTWTDAHEYFIANNETRNMAVINAVKLLLDNKRKTLVVAQRIQHNELLAKLLAEHLGEDNVYLLHGQLEHNYRKSALAEFKNRHDPCVMVASSVGNDGIDIPDISGIVLAHGGKSFFQNVQRAGRGLRVADGKEDLMFIDFDDSALGRWFRQHTNKRIEYYKSIGATIVQSDANQ